MRKELNARKKMIAKNMDYSPMVGCDERSGKRAKGTGLISCQHKLYGYVGGGK